MLRFQWLFTTVALLGLAVWLGTMAGCGERSAPVDPHEDHDHGAAGDTPSEHAEALAALSPEDRALAAKQRVCPVSGEPLGSMGTPVKVTVEGRDVLLCCQGCVSAVEGDPQKYLDKLPE
jgi:hypothetical protein